MTVFYLEILSGLGENPIYIRPEMSHYIQVYYDECGKPMIDPYYHKEIVEQLPPLDSYLAQLCNIF